MRVTVTALAYLLISVVLAADEPVAVSDLEPKILSLDTTVDVERDGSMIMRHKFDLQTDGDKIKRGPRLNFITVYKGPGGLVLDTDMKTLEVLRDGAVEEFHIEESEGRYSLFCGSPYITLEPGVYHYEVAFQSEGDWIFREKNAYGIFDIAGAFHGLPIEKLRARIQLPEGVRAEQFSASLIGNTGEGTGFVSVDSGDKLVLETTQALVPDHGVFMNVVWPAGDYATRSRWIQVMRQHPRIPISVFVGASLLWALGIVLIRAWRRPAPAAA